MTEIANHAGNEPWPSLEAASTWFDRASMVLAVSLMFGAAATVTIVWLGIVKEHHWDLLRERANQKIASVELEAAKSNAEAAKAHERIAELSTQAEGLRKDTAEANARATEAQLALEVFKEPRKIDSNAGSALVEGLKEYAGMRVDVIVNLAGSDAYFFGNGVYLAFHNAGWRSKTWNAIGSFPIPGVAVSAALWTGGDIKESEKHFAAQEKVISLLNQAGVSATTGMPFVIDRADPGETIGKFLEGPAWDPQDIAPIRIIVGPKPQ